MSDYLYLLDSHMNGDQSRLFNAVLATAADLNIAVYLTGGAMRDMLGGFPIRDLDFTFEAPVTKFAKQLSHELEGLEATEDTVRKIAELKLGNATGSLRMAQTVKVSKPGAAPRVSAAHILEDLARRDFTFNGIALSLHQASKGLLRDPANGLSDLQNKEVRMGYPQSFFDDPVRLLRAVRLRHRLGFQMEERTQRYFNTAVEERYMDALTPDQWRAELMLIAEENAPSEILTELAAAGVLPVPGAQLNIEGTARLEKLRRTVPNRTAAWPLFLHVLLSNMKPKERDAFAAAFGLLPSEIEAGKKIKAKAVKLAAVIGAPGVRKPSQVYNTIAPAATDEITWLLFEPSTRAVHDRLTNYLEKFLPIASEITDAQVEATGAKPGSAQFHKARAALITARLNAPPPPPPEENPAPPPPPGPGQKRAVR